MAPVEELVVYPFGQKPKAFLDGWSSDPSPSSPCPGRLARVGLEDGEGWNSHGEGQAENRILMNSHVGYETRSLSYEVTSLQPEEEPPVPQVQGWARGSICV